MRRVLLKAFKEGEILPYDRTASEVWCERWPYLSFLNSRCKSNVCGALN